MGEGVVVWLADEDGVRGCLRQKLTPLKQTRMGIQRVVALALDGENGPASLCCKFSGRMYCGVCWA